jgi:hypothetical protein
MASAMAKSFIHILLILYRRSVVSKCLIGFRVDCVSIFSLWLDFWCVGSATVWDTTTSQGILCCTNRLDFWKICSQICSLEIDSINSASWYIHILLGWSSILSLLRHRSVVYTCIHHHAILPHTKHFTPLIRHKFIHNYLIYELWSLLKEVHQRGQLVSPVSPDMTCKNALLLLLFLPIPCCKSFKIMLLQHVQHSIPLPILPSAATLRNILWPSRTVDVHKRSG